MSPQLESLKSAIQDMEKERDFYFGKLRNIELICQEKEGEDDETLASIMGILYATDVSTYYTVITLLLHRPAAPVQRATVRARWRSEDGELECLWRRVLVSFGLNTSPAVDPSAAKNSPPTPHWS